MKKLAAAVTLLLGMAATLAASELTYSGSPNNGVLAATQNVDLDLNQYHIDDLSVQLVYSSASPSTVSFVDGHISTGQVTVASLTGLTTAYATNKITVVSTNGLTGAYLTFNGYPINNTSWRVTRASHTAVDICAALNKDYRDLFISTVSPGGAVIYSTAVTAGTAANAYTLTSSTPSALSVNTAVFTGGQDNAVLTIAGLALTANRSYGLGASAATTATNIATAINASGLRDIIAASAASGVVYATSTNVGQVTNYTLVSSTPAALSVSAANMSGGINSDILLSSLVTPPFGYNNVAVYGSQGSTTTSAISKAASRWGAGLAVLFSKSAGTAPSPFVAGTTYYATNVTASYFQIAATSTGAVAGLALAITTTTQTGGGTFAFTPIVITGTPSFKLQKSNDGTNFQDLYVSTNPLVAPLQCSVSFASPYTASNALYDFGSVLFRYLRLAYTNGTWGGVNVNEIVNGKRK